QVVGVIQVMSYRLDAYTESNLRITEALASQIAVATNNALLYQRAQNEIAERARAEERIRRLLEQQLTVNELALALGKSRDLDRIYRIIYDHVLALMDATMFIISFYDCATQLVHAGYVASGEKELDVAAFPPIPLEEVGHGTQSQVIRTGQPWHVRDYRQAMSETETEYTITDDRKVAAGAPPANKREDSTNSALYVPMKIEGQTIGVMQVQSHQLDAYAQEDQDLLAGLANVAAIAIQNARLYDDAQRRNRELTLLNEVAREIATELDLDRLLDRAVRLVRDRFGYHHVAIFTVDREHGAVLMCARAGDLAALYPAQHRLAIDQGLVGWVAGHGETLLANDVHAEPRYVNLYPDLIPTRAELGVPIRLRGETMGVLDLQSPEVNAFAASEVAVMETVADQIAVALHNARLFAETAQLQAFHESIVQNMGDGIVVGDEDGVIDFVNPAAARMLGYGAVDLIGQPWTDLTPPDQPALIQAAQERGPVDQRELELAHQDGRRLAVLASVSPRFENDQWTGTLLVFSDISERQQAAAALEQGVARLRTTLDGIVNALASAVGARDPYTATHQRRVAQLARAIAAAMGLAEERLAGIRVAGLLHDLGKIHVPAEILSKPGRITDLEYRLIQTHVQAGYEILKTIEFPWPVAQIVLQHHERLDGSGYPAGLAGDSIILEARILGVADVVEAMASHRPYRAARGIGPALEEVSQQQGQLYDREVVMACLNLFYQQGFEFE
ncbi:MAG: GAF domain-containing protein, partial [Chloroflexi bacterium]|nr:GAF domain-containing protein [Chloroflexota bacterium]